METKYEHFIDFLFDRDQSLGDWRFNYETDEPDLAAEEVVRFVHRMLERYETDLAGYTDWQLGLGVDYVFNYACSDLSTHLRDGPVNVDERVSAILSLKVFFEKCLNERCVASLGHLSGKGNELNHFCYMVWDTTHLSYCEDTEEKAKIYSAIADVMEFSLSLSNIACIESGLHGLGHLESFYEGAPQIVRRFINSGRVSDERLVEYAKSAEQGDVL